MPKVRGNLVNHIKKGAKINSKMDGTQISIPKFTWVLRDFVLEMKDAKGKELSENEYLESRLSNFAKSKNQRNKKVREALMKNF